MFYIEELQVELAGKMLMKDIDLEIKSHEAAVRKVAQTENAFSGEPDYPCDAYIQS